VVRTLIVQPAVGSALVAVLLELPIMLAASPVAARALMRRNGITTLPGALMMGTCALACLLCAEAALARATGETLAAWIASLGTAAGLAGLAGQIVFGLMPCAVLAFSRSQ